jgi:hypothetical protein
MPEVFDVGRKLLDGECLFALKRIRRNSVAMVIMYLIIFQKKVLQSNEWPIRTFTNYDIIVQHNP